ncbi:MAG: isoleucine--tRNA ligase [Parcubacteria group bacterium]|jgi:isoleucyl-tRNA synthetase
MKNFKEVEQGKKYSEMEHEVMEFWREDQTFEKSVNARSVDNAYVFYDGPPFITGVPHYGTLLSSIIKDVVPRYWTMKGKRVERRWGWDCHGLPAENLVEKKLGIKDKRDVAKVGLETYIQTCHSAMVQGSDAWESTVERIGRWVNFKGAYKTMDRDYMESVWWAFKTLYDKKKIYEGEKVLLYCPRCATPISKAEVSMDNSYRDVTDPSVYVKFALEGEENTYMLAWTTTPWTLSANVALAINKDLLYRVVEIEYSTNEHAKINPGEKYIVANALFEKIFEGVFDNRTHKIIHKDGTETKFLWTENHLIEGKRLVGKRYKPLFDDHGENAHRIVAADFVGAEDGTGIVHIAPAFGEDDYALAKKESLPLVNTVDDNGLYKDGRWAGQHVWEINKEIAKTLLREGVVFKIDYVQHEYPHCHRCDTKLMYRAHPSWFMDIDGQRAEMLVKNENINWFPAHIKNKRFRHTVETAPDWNLSRDRFWATPLPVWRGTKEDGVMVEKVIGSYAELKELSGKDLPDYHLPYVDAVTFEWEGVTMKRIDKVMDCWFESGAMPFAQFHYPFENKEKFESNFPGDFIAEYIGQVRAWFYYMHAISVGIFGEEAFKNVIVTGTIAGNDGRKMSKSYGNYTAPEILLEKYSSDALRYLLVSSPLLNGEDFALVDKDVADVQRKLGTLWNSYSFFVMYANVDGWQLSKNGEVPKNKNVLDKWIVSQLHALIKSVDSDMQKYDLPNASKPIIKFIDDLSNWYIRRSRKRFWKSENDGDKNEAYQTLYYVLVELSKVMAPFTPFIAEEIYRNLTQCHCGCDPESQTKILKQVQDDSCSVHLCDFPLGDESSIDEELNVQMQLVRDVISEGLKLRARTQLKVRQPLQKLTVESKSWKVSQEMEDIVREELNVKEIVSIEKIDGEQKNIGEINGIKIELDIVVTDALKREGQAREIIRHIQQLRKKVGYNVDDRISVGVEGMADVFAVHKDIIAHEVLAKEISDSILVESDLAETCAIDNEHITISLKK